MSFSDTDLTKRTTALRHHASDEKCTKYDHIQISLRPSLTNGFRSADLDVIRNG